MEQFGLAYVQAVASAAGCQLDVPNYDFDSIDLTLTMKTSIGPWRSPKLDAQLKTTYQDVLRDEHVAYPLPIKNYNELRQTDYAVPRILIVVVVPDDIEGWISQCESELILKRCGYWVGLAGEPAVDNTTSKTVEVPRKNILDVDALKSLFEQDDSSSSPTAASASLSRIVAFMGGVRSDEDVSA
jgi:hypothetical protein